MTHPPSAPAPPPRPAGPKVPQVQPIDPDSDAGRAAAAEMSQTLAEIQVAIWRRKAAASASEVAA
ncbi:hypothetical protein [Micromonospora sp. DT229]|uniref:hypothetical protein n=1 Tax=Micromonospora sp. DT229 TaxID=3393430 RepID=UPI003CF5C543